MIFLPVRLVVCGIVMKAGLFKNVTTVITGGNNILTNKTGAANDFAAPVL